MNAWAAHVPVVTVGKAEQAKRVTFVYPYYQNAEFLSRQIEGWRRYPAEVRAWLSAIIVDDGSPQPASLPRDWPFPMRLFRIEKDVRWNWLAARNIGAHMADGWLVLTDMDHVVPVETARALVEGQHDPSMVYAFSREDYTGEAVGPHSASFFMTRSMFWTIGGYDERLSGFYGSDGIYRRRLMGLAPVLVLREKLIRHEHVSDSSTSTYLRKQPEDAGLAAVAKNLAGSRPRTLSFPYHEVTL